MREQHNRPTKKQRELLTFIDEFIKHHGYGPSYREVMRALNYKSVSTVATHVDNLTAKGHLTKKDNSARSLTVVKAGGAFVSPATINTAQQKWLIDQVTQRFDEAMRAPSQKQIDELFVLVGALHILGFADAVTSLKATLKTLKTTD